MIETGQLKRKISQHFTQLKTEIAQNGSSGFTDIHKDAEDLVKRLLNLVNGYRLQNLNYPATNYPGLDLGSSDNGIAYQVTSVKTSDKIADMLDKVTRHQHYITYPRIRAFILSGRQGSYTITSPDPNKFTFDWETDIEDFDTLLKQINQLDLEKLTEIAAYLDAELPGYLVRFNNDMHQQPVDSNFLLSVTDGQTLSGLPYYSHFSMRIALSGNTFSTPSLYRELQKFFSQPIQRRFLTIFNRAYEQPISSETITYLAPFAAGGYTNVWHSYILQLQENSIRFEHIELYSQKLLVTSMDNELQPLLVLLLFCQFIYNNTQLHINLDIDLATNADLTFHRQSIICKTVPTYVSHRLNPSKLQFSKVLKDTSNQTLLAMMQKIMEKFVASEQDFLSGSPFIEIDQTEQNRVLDTLKETFNLSR